MGLLSTLSLSLSSSFSLYLSLRVSLSLYLSSMLLTHCQDHNLTENIWFVWSRTSYSGDKRRCHRCGTYGHTDDKQTREDRATQPMDAGWLSFAISLKTWELVRNDLFSQYKDEQQNTIYTVVTMISNIFVLPSCFAAPASFDFAGDLAP